MVQSFFVYGLLGLMLFLLGRISYLREKQSIQLRRKTSFWSWEIFIALFLFAFVSGVRWNVGVDHLTYLNHYLRVQNGLNPYLNKEIGFEFITNLFAQSGLHFSFYFGFFAFLQLFFIYYAFKDHRYLYPFLGIIILFGPEYLNWMNGMRQMLSATIFVFSIQFIQNRQFLKYALTILFASLFHTSALGLIIFYFIPQRDYFKSRILTLFLVVFSLILGSMNFWIDSLNQFSQLFNLLGYDWYSENINVLIENNQVSNIGPRRLSLMLIPLLIIWFSPKLKVTYKNTFFLTYYNLALFGFLFYNIVANLNHGLIRPTTYLTIFIIPTTAYLLDYLRTNIHKMYPIYLITLLIVLSYLPLSIFADEGKGKVDYSNYKFYWDNYDQ